MSESWFRIMLDNMTVLFVCKDGPQENNKATTTSAASSCLIQSADHWVAVQQEPKMNPRPDHSTFVALFTSDLQDSGKPTIFNFPCLTQTDMMSKIPPSPSSQLSLLSPHLHSPCLLPPRGPVMVRGLLTEVHIPAGWHHHLRKIMKIEAGLQVGIMQQPRIPGESKTILSISPQFWPKLELSEFHSFSVVGNVPHPETLVNPKWDVLSVKEKPRRILGIWHSPTAHSSRSKLM